MSLRLKWLEQPSRNNYRRAKEHELRLAKELGGRRLPNSGGARRNRWDSRRSQGGDFETGEELVEHKHTTGKSISLKLAWWDKVLDGAARIGKRPVLMLTFVRRARPEVDLVVLSRGEYLRLKEGPLGPRDGK